MQAPAETSERTAFYERLAPLNLAPLWTVLGRLLTPEPVSAFEPAHWRYADVRPLLLEAGDLVTAAEAERRVLVLENPAFKGQSRITSTLYGGIQLVMPGETAPAHRHTPSALRFMLEGSGAYTAVGGERTSMHPGDFVITPAWAFHDHGNEGDDPCIWLDGLDLPMVAFFETIFSGGAAGERQELSRPEGDSLARFGQGLLPLEGGRHYGQTSPIFNYPYERTRAALKAAAAGAAPDPHMAVTLRYANPVDGGWAMPTMSAWMTFLPAGFETAPLRSTDGMVMCVAEGRVQARAGDTQTTMDQHDVLAVPSWSWRTLKAERDTFLFCFSDRVAQEKLGLFREERTTINSKE